MNVRVYPPRPVGRAAPPSVAPTTALSPLTVACFKWTPRPGYRSQFCSEHVNVLRRMVARHYGRPHRFVCFTDDAVGLDAEVEALPLWNEFAALPSPHGGNNPSCYRRLKLFHPDARELFGFERVVSLDLDCVVTADLAPLWDRPESFVIWGDTARGTPYNGSMFLLHAGARPAAWQRFDPVKSPRLARMRGYIGSDQAWLGVCLGPHERKWSAADGVYSYRNEVEPRGGLLPVGARIVFFHGKHDPWHRDVQARHAWVRDHWR